MDAPSPAEGPTDPQSAQRTIAELTEQVRRHRAAERLARNIAGRFRAVAENATEAIITINSAGQVVYWNPGANEMFGYSPDEMRGRELTAIMPPRYRRRHGQALAAAGETGRMHLLGKHIRLEGLRRDGREFPIELSISRWKTPEGTFYTGIIRDISELKRDEDELRRLTGQLRALAEAADKLHAMLDPAAVMRELVAAGMRLTDAAGGMSALHADGRLVVTEHYRGDRAEPVEWAFEWGQGVAGWVLQNCRPYLSNDAAVDVQVTPEVRERLEIRNLLAVPVLDSDSNILGSFQVHNKKGEADFNEQDIRILQTLAGMATHAMENALVMAQRVHAEQALRESEARFRALAEAASEGIAIHEEGVVLEVNTLFCEMFGYEPAELIGHEVFTMLAPPESLQLIRQKIAAKFEEPYGAIMRRKDGIAFLAELHARQVTYQGRTARVVAIRRISNAPDTPPQRAQGGS